MDRHVKWKKQQRDEMTQNKLMNIGNMIFSGISRGALG